jgi:serine/threonine-protein kinase
MTDPLRERLRVELGEAFTIESELPRGGMAHVFLAEEIALGRQVVIKVLDPELAVGVSAERFKREVMLTAKLQHPHIVPSTRRAK